MRVLLQVGVPPQGTERCSKRLCIKARQEVRDLKLKVTQLETKLRPLETKFKKEVADEVRTIKGEFSIKVDMMQDYAMSSSNATSKAKSFEQIATNAEAKVCELSDLVARLSAELSVLRSDNQARLKKEAATARHEQELSSKLHKEEIKERNRLQRRAEEAEAMAAEAERVAAEAREEAAAARGEAMAEAVAAEEARAAQGEAAYHAVLASRQTERAKGRAETLEQRVMELGTCPKSYSPEEWAEMSAAARRQARHRDMTYLRGLLESHPFKPADIATVLANMNLLESILFKCREGFDLYFTAVSKLMKKLEEEDFGESFALFLHYELRMPLPLIHRLVQAASKRFDREKGSYVGKVLLHHPWVKANTIEVCHTPPLPSPPHPTALGWVALGWGARAVSFDWTGKGQPRGTGLGDYVSPGANHEALHVNITRMGASPSSLPSLPSLPLSHPPSRSACRCRGSPHLGRSSTRSSQASARRLGCSRARMAPSPSAMLIRCCTSSCSVMPASSRCRRSPSSLPSARRPRWS